MKKTIVAAAIAAVVAAPAAFADVKIGGNVIVEYVDSNMVTRNDINVSASEDLGNGLKVSVAANNVYDDGSQGGGEFAITVAGDFGSIKAGRIEGFQEGVFDAFVNVDAAHDADLEADFAGGVDGFTRDEMIQYTTPNMNGLTASINCQDTASGNNSDMCDDNEVMVKYSANGLTVMAGTGEEGTTDYTNFAASYKMGDLELRAAHRATDDTTDTEANFYGAKYTMGANTIAVGYVDSDAANDDAKILSLSHAMSKTVSVYAVTRQEDTTGDDYTVVGMAAKF
jgi:predicted porin